MKTLFCPCGTFARISTVVNNKPICMYTLKYFIRFHVIRILNVANDVDYIHHLQLQVKPVMI